MFPNIFEPLNFNCHIVVTNCLFAGVLPLNPNQKVEDITDIKILDGLIRTHILIAEIVGRGSKYYVDYLLMAHAYLMRLWQVNNSLPGPSCSKSCSLNELISGENVNYSRKYNI